ncbi:hypothetical protein GCM10023185_14460 [Hymenobacter saemangeumensis]|uniref:IPT/TIG domain-containing protein n=1 Tax=Hymenobacter saemangeumensis TaxID=1084522 RepID=A0ABP8I959_9BACT
MTTFSTVQGTASAHQNYTVSGSSLTAGISIVSPTGYELALESATPNTPGAFSAYPAGSPLVLPQSGGSVASTKIYVRLAASATVAGNPYNGNIVHSSTGAASVNKAVAGTVTAPPTISSFTPANGPTGTVVTINGTNFTNAATVTFNGTTATTVSFVSSSQLTATVPTGATTGPIAVTVSGNTATSATSFTVDPTPNPVPTITSLSPNNAFAGGAGFTLTVTGTNFQTAATTTFTFGGTSYTPNTTGFTSTSFTVAIPAAAIATAGPKAVTVTNPAPGGGTATATFTVNPAALATYSTASLTGSAASVSPAATAANVTASAITRGSGLSVQSSTGGFNSGAWSTSGTPNLDDFLAFDLTMANGFFATINTITLSGTRTPAGPQTLELRYSTDGTNFSNPVSLGTASLPADGVDYSFSFTPAGGTLQAVLGSIYFRLYGYNATSTGNFTLKNVTAANALNVEGTVSAATPGTITVSTNGPLAVGATQQLVPSAPPVSYTVSGSSLGIIPLTIQAPAGFQVSTTAAFTGITADGNTLTLTPSGGSVPTTTIYVRLSGSGTVGPLTGNIVHSSGVSPTQNVAVTGTLNIAPPTIGVAQGGTGIAAGGSFAFPDTRVGVRNTQSFTVSNTGGQTLTISSISTMGSDFTVVGVLPTIVPAFSSATFSLRFEPSAIGARTGSVTLNSNDPTQPAYTFNLSGNGLASTFVRWTGAGGDNSFFTAANWSAGTVPGSTDDVLLDHSTVTGAYVVSMSGAGVAPVVLRSLTINPGGTAQPTIELEVPASNTLPDALTITAASGQPSLSIYAQGIVTNRSGATSAAGIVVTGSVLNAYIYNGGLYQHATVRSSSDLTDNLSGVGGTENGNFAFDVTPASAGQLTSIALQGRIFGNLSFVARDASGYAGSGTTSPFTINGNLIIASGTQFQNSITTTHVRGNIVNNGNLRFTGTNQQLIFDGQAPQSISGTALGSSTASGNSGLAASLTLQMANPTGLTLNTDVLITGTLDLQKGNINTNATTGRLTIAAAANITGGSASSYINGPLLRATATGARTLLFPIGKAGNFRPLTLGITAQTNTPTYSAEEFEGAPSTTPLTGGLTRVSSRRYFSLTPSVAPTGFSATLTIAFEVNDFVNYPADASFVVAKRDDASSPWVNIGRSASTGSTNGGFPVAGTLTSAAFTAFAPGSEFSLASTSASSINGFPGLNPLPVELTSFTASRQPAGVALRWTTASEKNNAYFMVERSLDGKFFTAIGRVEGHGNSARTYAYGLLDGQAPQQQLYYRLRQVDTDGKSSLSPVVVVGGSESKDLTVFPNPAQQSISFLAAGASPYRILNQLGQTLLHGTAETGLNMLPLDKLTAGSYLLELQTSQGRVVRKFVKE